MRVASIALLCGVLGMARGDWTEEMWDSIVVGSGPAGIISKS